jgi:predicted O-methyltransferase YrrM
LRKGADVTLIFMTLSGRNARMSLRAVVRTAVCRLARSASQAYAMRPATRRHEAGAKFPLSRAAPEPSPITENQAYRACARLAEHVNSNGIETQMTTLTQKPLSGLLDRLFVDADASEEALEQQMRDIPPEQRAADRADYRQLYARLRDQPLPVSRATGVLLYMLARSVGAQNVVEFGTSFGISTLHLAAALRDNGGGQLIGSEFEPSKVARARENLAAANLSDLVDIREGDALETFARDLPEPIDLVLLDGAKNLYPSIPSLLENCLRVGALIVADNADASPEYLARVRSVEHGYLSVPFAEDVELSMRIATAGSDSASSA